MTPAFFGDPSPGILSDGWHGPALLDETFGEIDGDPAGIHIHRGHELTNEGNLAAPAVESLENEPILCGSHGDIAHPADCLPIEIDHVAPDQVLDPPLVAVEVAPLVTLDEELCADEGLSVLTRVNTLEVEEEVDTVHPL